MNADTTTGVPVIGVGLSGVVTGLQPARAGLRVARLVRGDRRGPGDYPGSGSDFEPQVISA